jgi:transcriptional regulator with XRE-family HTH domain
MSILLDDLRTKKRILTPEEIKALYDRICSFADMGDRSGDGWMDVRALEIAMNADFKDTADFHYKVKSFLSKGRPESACMQLKKSRKKMGWKQIQLANMLGCSQQFVANMENGKSPLTKRAISFIELTHFPVFRKDVIIKQLLEARREASLGHVEGQNGCMGGTDSKEVTEAPEGVRGH